MGCRHEIAHRASSGFLFGIMVTTPSRRACKPVVLSREPPRSHTGNPTLGTLSWTIHPANVDTIETNPTSEEILQKLLGFILAARKTDTRSNQTGAYDAKIQIQSSPAQRQPVS